MASSVQSEFDLDSPAPPPQLTRYFLGWNKPLLTAAVDFLTRDWTGGLLDLSHLAVIVPTRNASRRLRESLAIRAAEKDAGVLPPRIFHPDDLLTLAEPKRPTASKAETLTAWIQVLRAAEVEALPHLFPVPPAEQSFAWALGAARDFMQVQSLLNEAAHNLSFAAKIAERHDLEPERWAELAKLENQVQALLESSHRQSQSATRREAVETFQLPSDCEQLVLLGLPDPPPALESLVRRLALRTKTLVAIHAPEECANDFDDLGRPLANWSSGPIAIPGEIIHQCANPASQATWTRKRIAEHPVEKAATRVALGIPDPELSAPLRKELADAGHATFDPAGTPLSRHGLVHLLENFLSLVSTQSLASLRDLLRAPGVAESAGQHKIPGEGEPFSAKRMLTAFDNFHELHLCNTLDDARAVEFEKRGDDPPAVTRGLSWTRHWIKRLEKDSVTAVLPDFLAEAYAKANGSLSEEFETAISLFHQVLDDFETISHNDLSSSEQGQLLLTLLGEQILPASPAPHSIDLLGWLELPWEDAPHLIITGVNEGFVPESIQGHAWLPNSARRFLGMRDNEQRQARDAFLLTSLFASRKTGGQIDLLFGRTNSQEDPLRPSRLLLATPPEELADRVKLLFQASDESLTTHPWQMSWQLTPPAPESNHPRLQRLSVTSFSKYLDCPFRFYLSSVLGMSAPDLDRSELNARDFGNVIHQVLEDFANSGAATSQNQKEVAEAFEDLLATVTTARFGPRPSAPHLLQIDSMRQRLTWWAESEARQRKEGWQIVKAEDYLAPKDSPFQLGGMLISGMIDRIEEHPKLGIRVLDFKTKRKPKGVVDAHIGKIPRAKSSEDYPEWARLNYEGKPRRWINLQVPLYVLALAERYRQLPPEQLTAGYVQLGMAKSDIYLDLWEELNRELLESARDCVLGVIGAIQAHRFWPPAESPEYDDFHDLLLGDPESAINPVNLLAPATQ